MSLISRELGLVPLLLISTFAQTQQPGPEAQPPSPSFTLSARSVVVDAVVTDRSGKPVPGLTRDEFRVFENGVPQKIDFFEPHFDAKDGKTGPAAPMPPNTFSNAQQAGPGGAVNVLLIDSLNTNTADRIRVRRQLLDLLNRLPNGVPTAVLELGDQLKIVQGFTSDPAQVRASVAHLLSGASQPLTQALPGGLQPRNLLPG